VNQTPSPPQAPRLGSAADVVMPVPTSQFSEFGPGQVEQSICDRFEQQVRKYPQRPAVKTARHGLTYEALNRSANLLARAVLSQCGQGAPPVAFLLEHGAPQLVAMFGILKAGKIYAALDASLFPPAQLAAMLNDLQAGALVTDNANLALAREVSRGARPLVNLDALDAGLADTDVGLSLAPDSPALILFTSGSTGQLKGVLHSHRNVLHYTRMPTNGMHIAAADRLALLSSCSFAGSLSSIFPALLNGAALFPFDLQGSGLVSLAHWLREQEITIYSSVTSVFRRLVGTLTGAESFPSLRIISLGGEPVTRKDAELYRKHFGPHCLLATGLAATEIMTVAGHLLDRETPVSGLRVPLGYAVPESAVLLLADDGSEVGPNEVGEIAVRSRYLALGYWRDPELTRAAFRPDPETGVRTYRMGDMGLLRADGCLEYRGRKDLQVKVRGYRVDVAEIETALLEVEGVKEAVVVGREDGAGGRRLVAYVVPTTRPAPSVRALRTALWASLPAYMVPSAFVFLDALPITPTGKVHRQALPEPDSSRPALDSAYEAPRDFLELALTELWEDYLHVRPVGIRDNFFELGGDSLLAVGMLTEVERLCGRKPPPDILLTALTVHRLADALLEQAGGPAPAPVQGGDPWERFFVLRREAAGGVLPGDAREKPAGTSLVAIQPEGTRRPLFLVHAALGGLVYYYRPLARCLGPDQPLYGLQQPSIEGSADPLTRVEEMAAHYLKEVRKVQAEGPYLLGGYCSGGFVAYEMARQLHALGQRTTLLVLIDSRQIWPGSAWTFLGQRLAFHLRSMLRLRPTRLPAYVRGRAGAAGYWINSFWRYLSRKYYRMRAKPFPTALRDTVETTNHAVAWYKKRPYAGKVTLFVANDPPVADPTPRGLGWGNCAAGDLEIHLLPAKHHTIMFPPHVDRMAEVLRERLEKAE
jgi:amino acid adenylation domain-containing protein